MRRLSTGLIVTVFSVSMGVTACTNEEAETNTHPILGKKKPLEVLNKDILALPEREKQAFIHGAMGQMITTLAQSQKGAGKCVTEWYFEVGNGYKTIPTWLERYPERPISVTLWAISKQYCPQLVG